MLILLGFFAVRRGSFIHSDIHRSVVDGGGDDWSDLPAGARSDLVRGAGAEEDDLRDGWGLQEFGAYRARRVAEGFLGEARDLRGGEGDAVEVGAAAVGIFAVTRRMGLGFCGEIH